MNDVKKTKKEKENETVPYTAFERWGGGYLERLSQEEKERVYQSWQKITLEDLKSFSDEQLKLIPKCWFYDWLHVHYTGMPTSEAESFLEEIIKRFPEKNNPYFRRG